MTLRVLEGFREHEGAVGDVPCLVHDPELWFASTPRGVERAKELCQDCPVRAMCLDGALARREPWGVWGGQLFLDGVVIPRKRPRGRPPKVRREELDGDHLAGSLDDDAARIA